MHHNLIIKDGDTTKVAKEVLVDGIQFVDEKPRAGSTNPVTSGGVANAVTDVLDDHATASQDEELTMPAAEAANYTVGNYFEQDGEIWKCTDKTDNGDGTWTVEAEKVNGVVPVLNELVSAQPKGRTEYTLNVTIDNNFTPGIPIEADSMTRLNVNCTNSADKTANIIVKPDSFICVTKTGYYYRTDFYIGRLVNGVFTPIQTVIISPPSLTFNSDETQVLASDTHGVPESFDDVGIIGVCGNNADVDYAEYTMKELNRFVIHVISDTFAIIYLPLP